MGRYIVDDAYSSAADGLLTLGRLRHDVANVTRGQVALRRFGNTDKLGVGDRRILVVIIW